MSIAVYIEGTLIIDGEKSKFCCNSGEGWNQWAAPMGRLCDSTELVKKIQLAVEELAAE